MRKIPTIFERDWHGDRSRVVDQIHPGCEWVFAGEGVATRKIDGTCCLVKDNRLYKRHEIKDGRPVPFGFEMADRDEVTSKVIGWLPVGNGPEDRWHRAAYAPDGLEDGTYELAGPKVQGDPEGFGIHLLIKHGSGMAGPVDDPPSRSFIEIRAWLAEHDVEGLVFHHPDGRMAKIKMRDFGLRRSARDRSALIARG